MENGGTVLSVCMFVIMFASLVMGSYKSGYIGFSGQSLFGGNRPKLEVDRSKIGVFVTAIFISLLINTVFAVVITQGDFAASLFFGAFNTIASSYALIYWILLKEKERSQSK